MLNERLSFACHPEQATCLRQVKGGMTTIVGLWLRPGHEAWVPHTPDFLLTWVGPMNFMRLSLKKAAHAYVLRSLLQEIRVSRLFFARYGSNAELDRKLLW